MGTWNSPPQIPNVPAIPAGKEPDMQYVSELSDYIKKMANVMSAMKNDLEFMLNGNLDANNVRANSIEAKNIKAGAITAEKIDVDKLSAISANMGTITAGLLQAVTIIGSLIQTKETGQYPRIELSSVGNLLSAFYNAANCINFLPVLSGAPAIEFVSNGVRAGTAYSATDDNVYVGAVRKDLYLTAWNNLFLQAGFGNVTINSWGKLYSTGNSQTLQQALDSLSNRISALGG